MTEEQFINQEDVDALIKRDTSGRWKAIDLAIRVDEELRDSITVNLILDSLTRHSTEAMEELIKTDPTNASKVSALQSMVKCVRLIGEGLESIRQNGLLAQMSLEDEGNVQLDEHNQGMTMTK